MILVNLIVGSRYPINRKKIRAFVVSELNDRGIKDAQVDVSIVGSRKIRELNESKLQHDGTTDVLSFPLHERHQINDFPVPEGTIPHLGDIVVSFPEAVNTAKRYGKLVDDQICFYIQHALMHLLGYHHD